MRDQPAVPLHCAECGTVVGQEVRLVRAIEVTAREVVLTVLAAVEALALLVLLILFTHGQAVEAGLRDAMFYRDAYEQSLRQENQIHQRLGRTCTLTVAQIVGGLGLGRNADLTTYSAVYAVGGGDDGESDPIRR